MSILNTALTLEDLPPPPPGKTGWPWTEGNKPLPQQMPDGSFYPRISIVTPSYNYGQYIEETIRSVLLQGYPNLEYIIIDGGSTDNTVDIIKKYEKYITYWVSEPDKGQTDAINKGYQRATGDIFSWLNADDSYLDTNCLLTVSQLYLRGYKFIAGRCLNIYNNGTEEIISSVPTNFQRYIRLWQHSALPQPSVFVAKEITNKCFPLDTELYMLMDYQYFLRAIYQKPKSIYLENIWTKINYHGQNKMTSGYAYGMAEWYKIALSESKKLHIIFRNYFLLDAEEYIILAPLINSSYLNTPMQVLTALASRPSIVRWLIFWKLLAKSLIGKQYLALKKVTK